MRLYDPDPAQSSAAQDAILASSTSALDPAAIFERLPGARRCLVAHPFNPPHVIPVVEILPSPWTDPVATEAAASFLEACGRTPVRMHRYLAGFLGNRIQPAVVRGLASGRDRRRRRRCG